MTAIPITELESAVIRVVKESLHEAIKTRMSSGYNDNPLNKLIDSVVVSHSEELRDILNEAMSAAFKKKDFKAELRDAFNHKLARILMSKFEGEIEKRTTELRASPEMRARITLAIEKAIKE